MEVIQDLGGVCRVPLALLASVTTTTARMMMEAVEVAITPITTYSNVMSSGRQCTKVVESSIILLRCHKAVVMS